MKIDIENGKIMIADMPMAYNPGITALGAVWRGSHWELPRSPGMAHGALQVLRDRPEGMELMKLGVVAGTYGQEPLVEEAPYRYKVLEPWAHQRMVYNFGYHKPGLMIDGGMGIGKTKIAIDLMMNRRHEKVLVICPSRAIGDVWTKQVKGHWDPTRGVLWQLALDTAKTVKRRADEWREMWHIVNGNKASFLLAAINLEAFRYPPFMEVIRQYPPDMVIFDEIHKLKEPKGKMQEAAAEISDLTNWKIGMTGTIMPHSPMDLWAQYRLIEPAIFGSNFYRFRGRYGVIKSQKFHNGTIQQVVGFKNQGEMHEKMYSIGIKVERDVLDLPKENYHYETVELEPVARRVYDRMDNDFYVAVGNGDITTNNVLTKILRLQQLVSGGAQLDDGTMEKVSDAKAQALKELLENIGRDEPVVVFARFQHEYADIRRVVAECGCWLSELTGATNDLLRWQEGGGGPGGVLLASLQTADASIDLTRACYGVFYTLGYLAQYEQAKARISRPPQDRPTHFYHLMVPKSIDGKMMYAIKHKKDINDVVLNWPKYVEVADEF